MEHPSPKDKLFQQKFSQKAELLFSQVKADIYYVRFP